MTFGRSRCRFLVSRRRADHARQVFLSYFKDEWRLGDFLISGLLLAGTGAWVVVERRRLRLEQRRRRRGDLRALRLRSSRDTGAVSGVRGGSVRDVGGELRGTAIMAGGSSPQRRGVEDCGDILELGWVCFLPAR